MIKGLVGILVVFLLTYVGYSVTRNMSIEQLEYIVEHKVVVLAACLLVTLMLVGIFIAIF
jgi:uncharacterized membrane protein YbjE (DUF340 family)